MERLTIKTPQGPALKMRAAYPSEEAAQEDLMRLFYVAVGRLAAYEDTMPLERAQELAQAEKDGRLVVLPARQKMLEYCPMRHPDNGNCVTAGGFCKPDTEICKALHVAYEQGIFDVRALKKREDELHEN